MAQNSYIPRLVDAELDDLLTTEPAISLEGPRAVGKTTTARQKVRSEFNLEDTAVLSTLLANPMLLVDAPEPILIDEWQRLSESWDLVRRAVDDDFRPGRFILTGSSTPPDRATHSGAGRIMTIRMRPMSLAERWADKHTPTVSLAALLAGDPVDDLANDSAVMPEISGETQLVLDDYVDEIVRGGFPVMREGATATIQQRLQGYCERVINTDFAQAGHTVRKPAALQQWLEAYAAAVSTTASYETIRDAAISNEGDKPARTTTIAYSDTLRGMWLVDPLPAWLPSNSRISRLRQASKHHLADPAIAASLLGASPEALLAGKQYGGLRHGELRDGELLGRLFESLVALNLRVYAQAAAAQVFHFRAKDGRREVDFIIKRGDGAVVAVEVKLKRVPQEQDFKHLLWLKDQIGDQLIDAVMVTTGPYAYRRQDGIAVVPAALLGP